MLVAAVVREDGKRTILGVTVVIGEHKLHRRSFMEELLQRRLSGVRIITSDDHAGLRSARKAIFGGVPWQRCQFHLQRNATAYVPKVEMRNGVYRDIRVILDIPDTNTALEVLRLTTAKVETSAPQLAKWMDTAIQESLSIVHLSSEIRKRLRTTNGLVSTNQEMRRRFKTIGSFVNEPSCLRLASAILMEISDAWQLGKA